MDAFKLSKRVLAATSAAEARIRATFDTSPTPGQLVSFTGGEGVWETAEGIGILRWERRDHVLLRDAVKWLCGQEHREGGYAPWPDVSSSQPYVEPTARVTMSLAGTFRALNTNQRKSVAPRLLRLARWIVGQQDPETGGWGSRRDFPLRVAPTTGAIQALYAFGQAQRRSDYADEANRAAEGGVAWLRRGANDDGGYGLRPGLKSNASSSGQAAWALSGVGAPVGQPLQDFLQRHVDDYADGRREKLPDVIDSVGDPAGQHLKGPFSLTWLGQPWALIGLLSAHGNAHADSTLTLVDSMLRAARDGVWTHEKRWVWPTYFHVIALRQWSWVYAAHSQVATVDLTALVEEPTIVPPREVVPTLTLPDERPEMAERIARVSELDDRRRRVLVGVVNGETYAQIGGELNLSPRTIEDDARKLRETFGVADSRELLSIAIAAGLVPCPCGHSIPRVTGTPT